MNNWQNWHQAFLANKKEKELKAFQKGLTGEPLEESYDFPLSVSSNWTDFINKAVNLEHKPDFNFDNNSLIFNHEILNLALLKSLKNITLIYPYDNSVINLSWITFKKRRFFCCFIFADGATPSNAINTRWVGLIKLI